MEKSLFLALVPGDRPALDRADIVRTNAAMLGALDPVRYPGLTLQVEDHDATSQWLRRQRPRARRLLAVLSVWSECADDHDEIDALMEAKLSSCEGVVVAESVPRPWAPRVPSSTEPQPGATVTSLLCRSASMSHDEFVAHWRDVHQPMSLRIHPQVSYVRNVVSRPLLDGIGLDAVCEEGFVSVDDVLDPSRFFGADDSGPTWQDNAAVIGKDVRKFLDADETSATITREYLLRDLRPRLQSALGPEPGGRP